MNALASDKALSRWWNRLEFLEWLIDDDPENLGTLAPEEADEEVLARAPSTGRVVGPWLAQCLLDGAGCYADPQVRRNSRLPALLRSQAEAALSRTSHECRRADGVGVGCIGCYTATCHYKAAAELSELSCAVVDVMHRDAAAASNTLSRHQGQAPREVRHEPTLIG